jgi:hypothetical protein
MFGGIYYGAMYGGSTTSILLNTPGETASIATALDGYLMARQGRGAAALTTAAIGSFVAGTLATMALTFFAPPLASVALRFGRPSTSRSGAWPSPRCRRCWRSSRRGLFSLFSAWRSGCRHRPAHRRAPLLVRHPAAARRHRRPHPRDRAVRRRRDALPGVAVRTAGARGGEMHDFTGMNREEWRGRGSRGLRARRSGFRSACCHAAVR